jgi:hypothetical protein
MHFRICRARSFSVERAIRATGVESERLAKAKYVTGSELLVDGGITAKFA